MTGLGIGKGSILQQRAAALLAAPSLTSFRPAGAWPRDAANGGAMNADQGCSDLTRHRLVLY